MGAESLSDSPDTGDEHPDRQPRHRYDHVSADRHIARREQHETRSRQEYYDTLVSSATYELDSLRSSTTRPATDRFEWQTLLSGGQVDRCGLGVIDERPKKFSPQERRIAEYLAEGGSAVVSVSEGYGVHGRTPDARVDGVPVEFKSLDPGASDRTVKATLNTAKGQARHAVIDARGSGLREAEAQLGIRRFTGSPHGDRQTFIFVGAPARDAELAHLVEQALGRQFTHEEGSDPFIRAGDVAVYAGGHEFDDDDIAWPEGRNIPLRSSYPAMIEVRDTGGDHHRQQEIADEIFRALGSAGRWRIVYIDDMQKVVNSYSPAG